MCCKNTELLSQLCLVVFHNHLPVTLWQWACLISPRSRDLQEITESIYSFWNRCLKAINFPIKVSPLKAQWGFLFPRFLIELFLFLMPNNKSCVFSLQSNLLICHWPAENSREQRKSTEMNSNFISVHWGIETQVKEVINWVIFHKIFDVYM